MALTTLVNVENNTPLTAIRKVLTAILARPDIEAIMVSTASASGASVMPELITDPDRLDRADPLSPCFPMNGARLVSRLTRKTMRKKIAVMLRPCEIRALVELVKLNQASLENLILVSMDCLGAFTNKDWAKLNASAPDDFNRSFYADRLGGKTAPDGGPDIAPACRACEYPVSDMADIQFCLLGSDISQAIPVTGQTRAGQDLITAMGVETGDLPADRSDRVAQLISDRLAFRDDMFAKTRDAIAPLENLSAYFERCVNCYNCRVACPVCYCRECVFNTDVFDHDPFQYLQKAQRSGAMKLPGDTLFFHMTRMAHMGLACVGCGQCSNACPNDIPVMEAFRLVAASAQSGFDYTPGMDLDQAPPLSRFSENEYANVVGI